MTYFDNMQREFSLKRSGLMLMGLGIAQFMAALLWYQIVLYKPLSIAFNRDSASQRSYTIRPLRDGDYDLGFAYSFVDTGLSKVIDDNFEMQWQIKDEKGNTLFQGQRQGNDACGWSKNKIETCLDHLNLSAWKRYTLEVQTTHPTAEPALKSKLQVRAHPNETKNAFFLTFLSGATFLVFALIGNGLIFVHWMWGRSLLKLSSVRRSRPFLNECDSQMKL